MSSQGIFGKLKAAKIYQFNRGLEHRIDIQLEALQQACLNMQVNVAREEWVPTEVVQVYDNISFAVLKAHLLFGDRVVYQESMRVR